MSPVPDAAGRVLLAEPDPAVRRSIAAELSRRGLTVEQVREGEVAVRLGAAMPDVAVVGLPEVGGLELIDRLRRASTVPLIVLLATDRTVDPVEALDRGADDYLRKPFPVRELAAKVRAMRRRCSGDRAALRAGDLALDVSARKVEVSGRPVELPPRELELLAFLMANPGVAFSRTELIERVWHASESWLGVATVTEHVRRLRLRLEADPARPRHIVTVRGVGYRFEGSGPVPSGGSFPVASLRESLP